MELLLRTIVQKTKGYRVALYGYCNRNPEKNSALCIKLHNQTTFLDIHPRDYHLGFRAAFRAASDPRPFAAREVWSSLNLRLT